MQEVRQEWDQRCHGVHPPTMQAVVHTDYAPPQGQPTAHPQAPPMAPLTAQWCSPPWHSPPPQQQAMQQQAHDPGQALVATTSVTLGKYIGTTACLVLGEPKEAARGICNLLGIDRLSLSRILQDPIKSMQDEFRVLGGEDYAVFAEHNRKPLLKRLKSTTGANLETHHVLALRLYTTRLFTVINDPLREGSRPHPLASTVSLAITTLPARTTSNECSRLINAVCTGIFHL
jgi:hypothetical protein